MMKKIRTAVENQYTMAMNDMAIASPAAYHSDLFAEASAELNQIDAFLDDLEYLLAWADDDRGFGI